MGKIEDFGKVIKVVAELTDVTEQDIFGNSRIPEVVDARWLVIYLMRCKGYSSRQIASLLLHSPRTINHVLSNFEDRVRFSHNNLGNILATARKEVL